MSHLGELHGVETRALVQAVQGNRERFPDDSMFQLTKEEIDSLRSYSVISNPGWPALPALRLHGARRGYAL